MRPVMEVVGQSLGVRGGVGTPGCLSLVAAYFAPTVRSARKGGELRRTWHGRVRAFRWRPRLPPRSASGLRRPPHPPDAGHPALAEYRLRGLASPRRRGGASGRPRCARLRVRPRPVLRAGGTTFGLPYGASLALAPTLRRRSAALPQDGCIYPVAQP